MPRFRPDEVDLDPAAYRRGRDTRLEKAIEVVRRLLEEHPRPPYPNYHQDDGLGKS